MNLGNNTQLAAILSIRYLGEGLENLDEGKKKRISICPLLILYQLFLSNKEVLKGKWISNFLSKEKIAEYTKKAPKKISRSSITRFITDPSAEMFVDIHRRGRKKSGRFESNVYFLKKEMVEALSFLERKGFFKKMENRKKWRKWFVDRLERWLIPLLEKGLTYEQIARGEKSIMDKLSTETASKRAAVEPPKRAGITLRSSLMTQRHLDNEHVESPDPLFAEFLKVQGNLLHCLCINEMGAKKFLINNSLRLLSDAVDEVCLWKRNGSRFRNPEAVLQSALSKRRRNAK